MSPALLNNLPGQGISQPRFKMPKRSNRTATLIENDSEKVSNGTARQLLELLQQGGVKRVTLRHHLEYHTKILSDQGSQFIVYTGDGVNSFDKGHVVVKCPKFKVGNEPLLKTDKNRVSKPTESLATKFF